MLINKANLGTLMDTKLNIDLFPLQRYLQNQERVYKSPWVTMPECRVR